MPGLGYPHGSSPPSLLLTSSPLDPATSPPPVPPGPTLLFDAIERYYRLMTSDDPAERETLATLERWLDRKSVV